MKRLVSSVALNALTLVGGHFINRRWDRALLLFVMMVLFSAGVYISAIVRMNDHKAAGSGEGLLRVMTSHWQIFLYKFKWSDPLKTVGY